jgi:hypothetical protein
MAVNYNEIIMDQENQAKTAASSEPKPRRSAHIIDLRQSREASATGTQAAVKPAKPAAPRSKAPTKPESRRRAKPEPMPDLHTDGHIDVLDSPRSQRRFWPSFFRFLGLLILLGSIIAAGLYFYLNYYRQ